MPTSCRAPTRVSRDCRDRRGRRRDPRLTPAAPALAGATTAGVGEASTALRGPRAGRHAAVHTAPGADAYAPSGIAIHDHSCDARGAPLRPAARPTERTPRLPRCVPRAGGMLGATRLASVETRDQLANATEVHIPTRVVASP